MVPKGFRKNIRLVKDSVGFDRRQELLDNISVNGTFLPRGVGYEDIDSSYIDFVKNELSITIDGEKVPVLFLTIQRWSEFSKSWQFSDKYKDIKMPFITIVRQPNPQVGTNQAGLYNIPGRRTYTYMKVPTFEGGRKGVDLYKIPQPTSVDLTYEVRLFCNRMRDLNKLNELVQKTFQSRQFYIKVNGHPMPVLLESIGDESNIDDFENRRFYVQPYEMVIYAYIQDEEDYEVVPTVNRSLVFTEVIDGDVRPKYNVKIDELQKCATFNFIFKANSSNNFTFKSKYDLDFISLINLNNINNIVISINGDEVFNGVNLVNPIVVNSDDNVHIRILRNNNGLDSDFSLIGNIR